MTIELITNFINNEMRQAADGDSYSKLNPHSGKELFRVVRSNKADVHIAIESAKKAQSQWADLTPVARGDLMREISLLMMKRKNEIAEIVALETGKSPNEALGETQAAIELGLFIAGEGRRNYGKTTTASMANRRVMTIRQPVGIAALIIAANTPIANVAWKAFPAMFCGNASIMKPSEDTPATAWIFADICKQSGLPKGVFNVINGYGSEAGELLVKSDDIDLVSFTGGTKTGRHIQQIAGERLAKVCMELGGKNALVVCEDADLDRALEWVMQSTFSNAGQRCASASRIIIDQKIYESFRKMLIEATNVLKIGPTNDDFLGPVINLRQLDNMVNAVKEARESGAKVLVGGDRMTDDSHSAGFYMTPTILDEVDPSWPISQKELFGPVAILFKARDYNDALRLANNSFYGLTASIHTSNLHRAMHFSDNVRTGVVIVNGGTHGSEPHMGFGGVKNSGTGWREPGTEALDVYSEWKYVNIITHPDRV